MDNEVSYKLAFENGKLHEEIIASELFKKISEGCENVINEKDIHEDAKKFAKLVISDCNKYLLGE